MTHTFTNTLKFIFILIAFVAAALAFIPTQTHAYFTTHQDVRELNGQTALFLIEYSFGMDTHEVFLPILAQNSVEKRNDAVSYSILNPDGQRAKGTTAAIVLSTADITDDFMYMTEKKKSERFMLAVFFTPDAVQDTSKYRLQVNHLPFNFDQKQQLQLNPSELLYYTTKYMRL